MKNMNAFDFGRHLQKILGLPEKEKRSHQKQLAARILGEVGSVDFDDAFGYGGDAPNDESIPNNAASKWQIPDLCRLYVANDIGGQCICVYGSQSNKQGLCGGSDTPAMSRQEFDLAQVRATLEYQIYALQYEGAELKSFTEVALFYEELVGLDKILSALQGFQQKAENPTDFDILIEAIKKDGEISWTERREQINGRYVNVDYRIFSRSRLGDNLSKLTLSDGVPIEYQDRAILNYDLSNLILEYQTDPGLYVSGDDVLFKSGLRTYLKLIFVPYHEEDTYEGYLAKRRAKMSECVSLLATAGGFMAYCPNDERIPPLLRGGIFPSVALYDAQGNAVHLTASRNGGYFILYQGQIIELKSDFETIQSISRL